MRVRSSTGALGPAPRCVSQIPMATCSWSPRSPRTSPRRPLRCPYARDAQRLLSRREVLDCRDAAVGQREHIEQLTREGLLADLPQGGRADAEHDGLLASGELEGFGRFEAFLDLRGEHVEHLP